MSKSSQSWDVPCEKGSPDLNKAKSVASGTSKPEGEAQSKGIDGDWANPPCVGNGRGL